MYKKLRDKILNKKVEQNTLIGTVDSLSPFKVTLIPGDTAIPVVYTTNLNGVCVGSRIVLQKFLNQFIGIAVLGNPTNKYYGKSGNQEITGTTMENITGMVFTLKANSGIYAIDVLLNARNEESATPDGKFDWDITGSDYTVVSARSTRGGESQSNSSTSFTACRNSAGHGLATDVYYTFPESSVSSHIQEHFVIQTGVSDTIFQYRGSQINNDAGSPLIVSGYSHILVTKLTLLEGDI